MHYLVLRISLDGADVILSGIAFTRETSSSIKSLFLETF